MRKRDFTDLGLTRLCFDTLPDCEIISDLKRDVFTEAIAGNRLNSDGFKGVNLRKINDSPEVAVLKAISLMESNGYKPKVFCRYKMEGAFENFTVKSRDWNWIITELSPKTRIPDRARNVLKILKEHGIEPSRIAIAKPKRRETAGSVIKQAVNHEIRTYSKVFAFIITAFLTILKTATDTAEQITRATGDSLVEFARYVRPKDPVLLISFSDSDGSWLELYRW